MAIRATFDRPVKVTLMIVPEHGEPWEPTEDDLRKFNLADRWKLYERFRAMYFRMLDIDEDQQNDAVSEMRYLVECAVLHDHEPDHDWARMTPEEREDSEHPMAHMRAALLGVKFNPAGPEKEED